MPEKVNNAIKLENGLVETQRFMELLVSLSPDPIIGADRQGVVTIFNKAAEHLTGWRAEQVIGQMSITQFYQLSEMARQIKKRLYSPDMGGVGRLEGLDTELRTKDGHAVPIRLSAVLLHDESGAEVGSVGFFHDLTRSKRLERELRRLSITDSLTGLFNRRHFHMVLAEEVARGHRYDRALSLVCFDLDNFKPFNDTYGHQEGDNILRLVARTTRETLRGQDTAFRYGGDEFALLLVETDLGQATVAAERFREGFSRRWEEAMNYLGGELPQVTFSLGAAQLMPGEKMDNLLLRADLAMYEAKKAGGDRTVEAGTAIGRRVPPHR